MRFRRRTHHSPVVWSGSDEEFQSQSPRPAWDAACDGVRAERKQVGLPNTYARFIILRCGWVQSRLLVCRRMFAHSKARRQMAILGLGVPE